MSTLPGGTADPLAGAYYYDTGSGNLMQNTGNGYTGVVGGVSSGLFGNLANSLSGGSLTGGSTAGSASNGISGAVGSGTFVDPYAAYGGTTAYNNLVGGFDTQNNNIVNSATDAARNMGGNFSANAQDIIHNLGLSQKAIDAKRVQNEASKMQGSRDILDMVGRGIRSGGVTLANGNAGSSSAAQAIADAYSRLGQRQMSSVGNQYAANNTANDQSQAEQNYQVAQAPTKFHQQIVDSVNSIVADATNKIVSLQTAMANASLPTRIALDQEVQQIRNNALGVLQQYDSQLQQGVAGVGPASNDTNRSVAASQLAAGQAGPNLFNYTTQAPAAVQNTGPVASDLPLFSYNRKTQTA